MQKLLSSLACIAVAAVAHSQPIICRIQANTAVSVTLPDAASVRTVEYLAPDGTAVAISQKRTGGNLTFEVTARMLEAGNALIILNRPPGKDASDRDPPMIERILVDGQSIPVKEDTTLPYQPAEFIFEIADASGIAAGGLVVRVNGKAAEGLTRSRRDGGRRWTVRLVPPKGVKVKTVAVQACDEALLGNRMRFSIAVERAVDVVSGDEYSGGKAVLLNGESAALGTRIELPAGDYEIELTGFGPNSGSNSLFIELDGKRLPDVVHLPERALGIASRLVEQDPTALPVLKIPAAGSHILSFVIREPPISTVDRVRILRNGKEVARFEAENMLPPFGRP